MKLIGVKFFVPTLVISAALLLTSAAFGQNERLMGGSGITVFKDRNFRGNAATYQRDMPDLYNTGFDRSISSLRIGPGEQWEVCSDTNYRGQCVVVSGEESDLDRNNWDNRIRSFRRSSGGGGGGGSVRPPSWARGTFYGTAPYGQQITLTIDNDGRVSANIGGSMSYGSYQSGNHIEINGVRSRVTSSGNGITTTRLDNGERITYSRTGWGDGGAGGSDNNDRVRPPSWARGRFRGTAPDGSFIYLTIESDGRVTANIGGSMSYGYYGRGDYLSINGARSRVSRTRSGILTTRYDNGETLAYDKY